MLIKFFTISLLLFSINSLAFAPEDYLSEPQEQRARELFLQIRCPVCAGQVIESSDAPVALELRKLVREKIKAGENDEQIKAELVENYGEDILVSGEISKNNFMIYLLPMIFIVGGIWFFLRNFIFRKSK